MATSLAAEYENEIRGANDNNNNNSNNQRIEIIEELEDLGVVTSSLSLLTDGELESLLGSLSSLVEAHAPRRGRPRAGTNGPVILSEVDRKILQRFFSKHGDITSLSLSKELGVPLSTVQRRRKRLEDNLIEISYSPRLEKLGWRTASLSILAGCNVQELGEAILEMSDRVLSATRIIGRDDADMVVQVVFRTNSELMSLIDLIKEKEGVHAVSWSEVVELIGTNTAGYLQVIDDT
ncbi:MAG: winged helix-turn-helix transcriptional regulator [Nitrososphaera sp.]